MENIKLFEGIWRMRDIETVDLSGGARLLSYKTDRFKTESLSLYLAFPEDAGRGTELSLLLSTLKRGCVKYPTQSSINRRLDELYATELSFKDMKTDSLHLLGLNADVLRPEYTDGECDLLAETLSLMNEILFSPLLSDAGDAFLEGYVESEKKNQLSLIDSQINEPRSYAAIRCREETYAELGLFDTLDMAREKIRSADARSLYRTYLDVLGQARLLVFYVGDREAESIAELAGPTQVHLEKFHNSSKKDTDINIDTRTPHRLAKRHTPAYIEEARDVSQGRLAISLECGVLRTDEEYPAMLIFNELFGASPASRLMNALRTERGLCYECSSVYSSARGVIFVSTGIDAQDSEPARDEILRQVSLIADGDISDGEICAAKKTLCGYYGTVTDSASAIERYYLGAVLGGSRLDPDLFAAELQRLTREDIARAAGRLSPHTVYLLRGDADGEEADDGE